jgi:hypothetical protein
MPKVLLRFSPQDFDLIKAILGEDYPRVPVEMDGRNEEGIELPLDLPARDFYGVMAVFLQNSVAWR